MTFDLLSVVPFSKIRKIKRIAEAFSTKKGGPFRLSGDSIQLIADDTVKVGSIEIRPFNDSLYYFVVLIDHVCFSYDEKYYSQFIEYMRLLVWLENMWGVTEKVVCPICSVSVFVNDDIRLLVDHISREHKNILVHGFLSCGNDVKLRTSIGDYILDDCKIY